MPEKLIESIIFIMSSCIPPKKVVVCTETFVHRRKTHRREGVTMKYVVILADGMADRPIEALGGKTPLEAANTPTMDYLAMHGRMGTAKTVPAGMKPGSDVANLSVFGYDPAKCYSGRSPLEALSVGVQMKDTDVIYRCNLVTMSEDEPYEQKILIDHSSGEISTQDADILMDAIREVFNSENIHFYTGTSYRHITVWNNGHELDMEPPHDHLGVQAGPYLPDNPMFLDMMKRSFDILNNHPLNVERAKMGLNKANSIWFWGAGTKPSLENFTQKTGLRGSVISAVDLLKGIAVGAGMDVLHVPGATGSLETNYIGKAQAALKSLLEDGSDYTYIHIEAPDEMGHQGRMMDKVKSIELIDEQVVKVVKDGLEDAGCDFRMLVLPDHPTPLSIRTHTSDPVPYVLYDSTKNMQSTDGYSEKNAQKTGNYLPFGHLLLNELIG